MAHKSTGQDTADAHLNRQVEYKDSSHFSREYKRLFGEPPMRMSSG